MKKCFLALVCALFFVSNSFSQTVNPTPPPKPADDDDVVKISTSLIQIDVSVTDKDGKLVSDIKPEEIEIYENGKKQSISNFSFISNVRTRTENPVSDAKGQVNLPVPPREVKTENVRRTIALVVDDLTLSFESVYYVRRALKKFVDEQMQDGDLVAIIRTGAGIGALQQFTTDKRQLYAAIEKVKWNPLGNGKVGAFAPLESVTGQEDTSGNDSEDETTSQNVGDTELNNLRESIFATGTLGAVNFIVRGMQNLPGRKSIMLLSDGFRIIQTNESGFSETSRVFDSLKLLIDLANRSSVVIYTMDARGLQTAGLTAADDVSERSAKQIEQAMTARRAELFDTQEGLRYLAQQTGGISVVNSNDLSGGIKRMLDDQSYYLIGYQPDEELFDPAKRRFNKLDVKVLRAGAKVRYRSGFFGVSNEAIADRPTANLTPAQQINNALTSPFAVNEISLRLNALFSADAKQQTFIRSFLHIKGGDISFTDNADGSKKAVFDIVAVSFGDNGTVADEISKTYTMNIKEDAYKILKENGFVYDFTFPMKKSGAYQLRIALRDSTSGKVGSANQFVEVPNLKKDRLTLSGLVLENISLKEWSSRNEGKPPAEVIVEPQTATSLRQFKRGTVLNFGTQVYNAKHDSSQKTNLTYQTRVFRDGKLLFEGKPKEIPAENMLDQQRVLISSSLSLGKEMQLGEYVLQVVVIDNLANEKRKIAAQFVQFELVE
ncbi:MAG TPA: VWA domain-containing protein [Pyrinomonadaceae bacterium]|nr:VWA domain-containing protein [Pyrinomonadaceae bacterium]